MYTYLGKNTKNFKLYIYTQIALLYETYIEETISSHHDIHLKIGTEVSEVGGVRVTSGSFSRPCEDVPRRVGSTVGSHELVAHGGGLGK